MIYISIPFTSQFFYNELPLAQSSNEGSGHDDAAKPYEIIYAYAFPILRTAANRVANGYQNNWELVSYTTFLYEESGEGYDSNSLF